ncbi:unnamed protein product, partial [Iphiclides podalirius]
MTAWNAAMSAETVMTIRPSASGTAEPLVHPVNHTSWRRARGVHKIQNLKTNGTQPTRSAPLGEQQKYPGTTPGSKIVRGTDASCIQNWPVGRPTYRLIKFPCPHPAHASPAPDPSRPFRSQPPRAAVMH